MSIPVQGHTPALICVIAKLERVKEAATWIVPDLRHLSHSELLNRLQLIEIR